MEETLLNTKTLSANLFLKHLIVLSDIGGEKLMRFKKELPNSFKNGMDFIWDNKNYKYSFQTLTDISTWNNKNLSVDGEGLTDTVDLNPNNGRCMHVYCYSVVQQINEEIPSDITTKCIIGTMLGKTDELENFVKQRYIWVSRITGGAEANTLGQLAQNFVKEF
ncbi:MAG: hypothetical protein U5Q03_07860 [Bacteroidota bacterium]|nr:hypothetical protein [Bacteroidota bacterium]